jgi:hypothetical protein
MASLCGAGCQCWRACLRSTCMHHGRHHRCDTKCTTSYMHQTESRGIAVLCMVSCNRRACLDSTLHAAWTSPQVRILSQHSVIQTVVELGDSLHGIYSVFAMQVCCSAAVHAVPVLARMPAQHMHAPWTSPQVRVPLRSADIDDCTEVAHVCVGLCLELTCV